MVFRGVGGSDSVDVLAGKPGAAGLRAVACANSSRGAEQGRHVAHDVSTLDCWNCPAGWRLSYVVLVDALLLALFSSDHCCFYSSGGACPFRTESGPAASGDDARAVGTLLL